MTHRVWGRSVQSGRAAGYRQAAASPERQPEALGSGWFAGGEHRVAMRVYMDMIGGGEHVYNGYYLTFCERARTDLFRLLEALNPDMERQPYVRYMVVAIEQQLRRPLSLHDVVTVTTAVVHVGRSSCKLEHRLLRGEADIAGASLTLVFTDESGRAVEQPRAWIEAFGRAVEQT